MNSTGITWLIVMPESPHDAKFLTEEERVIAVQRVAANMMGINSYEWKYYQIWHCAKDPKTWFLAGFVFFSYVAEWRCAEHPSTTLLSLEAI
jgi:hypothetical protein